MDRPSARARRDPCVARDCPTSPGGPASAASGSAAPTLSAGQVGMAALSGVTLFARLRSALASASETSRPAYAASSSPATGSWLY